MGHSFNVLSNESVGAEKRTHNLPNDKKMGYMLLTILSCTSDIAAVGLNLKILSCWDIYFIRRKHWDKNRSL